MSPEPPEFHTKTLSPLSPLPVHPSEPSNIPVLRNQIDPVFSMTSTHFDPQTADPASLKTVEPITEFITQADSQSDSSFSDAYKELSGMEEIGDEQVKQGTEVSDDYALTFDSDGEEHGDIQDVSQANIDPKTRDLPVSVPDHELSSSSIAHDSSVDRAQNGTDPSTQPKLPLAQPTSADTPTNPHSIPVQTSIETTTPQSHTYDDVANGGIDIQQLLDNITANAEKNESSTPTQSVNTSLLKAKPGLATHSSLPPRPQIPQKRPNPYQDDIQKYHTPPGVQQPPSSFRPLGVAPSFIAAGAPGTSTDPRVGLPPPPSASFRPPPQTTVSPISPASYSQIDRSSGQDHLTKSIESRDEVDDIDQRWGPDVQKLYDKFLEDERMYVTEGLWDRFPVGSRLFIGNLPSEKVTKRDLFHVFHKYGKLAQVSIKQAYGFIQFHDSPACYQALKYEQGSEVRGRKMHLEISKPQKNSSNAQRGAASVMPLRRSRSPDYSRGGGMTDRGGRQGRNSNNDRYDNRSAPNARVDEYGRPLRSRDDYRPQRSISPLRSNIRGRESFDSRRDSYGRDRGRDRSRSPYGQRDNGRYRERSLSPRVREANADADLQIPRRDPRNIPDIQIILMEQLDRNFVSWVESEMGGRGIKTEVMFLSSRLPLDAIIRRQILEGVHAVSQLDMMSQNSSKIPLQVFDRQAGANNVRFDEYRDLEPKIAAELVLRTKQTQPQIMPSTFAQPQYSVPQTYQPPVVAPAAPAAPNLANIVGQLDNASLQKLLGSLSTPQQQNAPAVAANSAIDLAALLGGLQQQQSPQQGYQPQLDPYANQPNNPTLTSFLGNGALPQPPQAQPQPQQSAQQVQNIMAQLAKFRQ